MPKPHPQSSSRIWGPTLTPNLSRQPLQWFSHSTELWSDGSITQHRSVLLTGAKTQMNVLSFEGKEVSGGKAKINNKAICKDSKRRNNSTSLFWLV